MAKPRVFVSSTFYDLRHVRADLFSFIKELGYEPVLNEFGHIAYGKEQKLEEYCYKEISNIDILISIVGGRFGSNSTYGSQSISQMEVKTALDLNKQIYIFIDSNVYAEYQTYLVNKDSSSIKYRFVDDKKIYEFVEFLESLPNNNNISSFETTQDIIVYLREQWAGLFQRFLQEQTRIKEVNLLKSVENTAKTLNQLVTFITDERKDSDTAIRDILLSNHPAMEQLRQLLKVKYKVYFTTVEELFEWLNARGFKQLGDDEIFYTFDMTNDRIGKYYLLTINKEIFKADGKLKIYTKTDWIPNNIVLEEMDLVHDDSDIPF